MRAIWDKHWPLVKLGQASANHFWHDVCDQSQKHVNINLLQDLYQSDISVNLAVMAFAEKLTRQGYQLAIAANESKEWMAIKMQKFRLNQIFQKIYCSALLGAAKPNEKFFQTIITDLNKPVENVIFIDNQQANINTATMMGMRTILFVTANQLQKDLSSILYLPQK